MSVDVIATTRRRVVIEMIQATKVAPVTKATFVWLSDAVLEEQVRAQRLFGGIRLGAFAAAELKNCKSREISK